MIDTLELTVPISLDQSRLVNPYAALPSLHVAWNLLIAIGLFYATRNPTLRIIAILLPPTMLLATVITGNHFFIDGIAGGTLCGPGVPACQMALSGLAKYSGATPRPDSTPAGDNSPGSVI